MEIISVYLNPRASRSLSENWRGLLERKFFRSQLSFHRPNGFEELNLEIANDLRAGIRNFICIGGDGSVNAMLPSLAGHDVQLLVLPGGTANDLSCYLSQGYSLTRYLESVRHDESSKMDLININDRFMATNGGIGLGADVACKINYIRQKFPLFKKIMKLSGKKIYGAFVAREFFLMELPCYHLELESDEFSGRVKAPILLINNQPVIAGTFPIAPQTRNNDGTFSVAILKHQNRNALFRCIYRIAAGRDIRDDEDFIEFETKEIKMRNVGKEKDMVFFGDGEIFEISDTYHAKIAPASLKVFRPCLSLEKKKHDYQGAYLS